MTQPFFTQLLRRNVAGLSVAFGIVKILYLKKFFFLLEFKKILMLLFLGCKNRLLIKRSNIPNNSD